MLQCCVGQGCSCLGVRGAGREHSCVPCLEGLLDVGGWWWAYVWGLAPRVLAQALFVVGLLVAELVAAGECGSMTVHSTSPSIAYGSALWKQIVWAPFPLCACVIPGCGLVASVNVPRAHIGIKGVNGSQPDWVGRALLVVACTCRHGGRVRL
jgi:hypothetical protein